MRAASLALPCLLLLACAGARGSSASVSADAPRAAGTARSSVQSVACPADIVREPVLGNGVGELEAGAWLQDVSPEALRRLGAVQGLRTALPLASGNHEVVSFSHGIALLREQPQGACVVNSWGVFLGGELTLRPAGSWRSEDGRLAVLLLSIVTRSEGKEPEQRWMVLTTDGRRLWPAVGEAGQQLMVPAVALVERQGQLQLQVRQSRTSVYAFDPRSGRFITQ